MGAKFFPPAKARIGVRCGVFDEKLRMFYGTEELSEYRDRIAAAIERFTELYGNIPVRIFSVPGRTELGGNHTDHQHGNVLAGAVSLDILAIAAKTDDGLMRVQSEGYPADCVAAGDYAVSPLECGTSAALLRGTAAQFVKRGCKVGGFVVYTTSDVLEGSGLSSSAAYEVMLGKICNDFYADNAFSAEELAKIAKFVENRYFGKPCGLMDQMACALGGICAMDFSYPENPRYQQLAFDFSKTGYALCIVNSGASHSDLTQEYAAVPAEMCAVAAVCGKKVLRDVRESVFWTRIPELREKCGDRAVMRAIHFYDDNVRVQRQINALEYGNFSEYLSLVQESGESSVLALQNICAAGSTREQPLAVALALCKHLLNGYGACRVHGGGFAGTAQVYVPAEKAEDFRQKINAMLGEGACRILQIRNCGAAALWDDAEEDDECC